MVVPAWAGVILTLQGLFKTDVCSPRVGGGDPGNKELWLALKE